MTITLASGRTITLSRKVLALIALAVTALLVLAGCGDKITEPFQDAPRAGNADSSSMRVIENADGFSNVGEKCDSYGHLIVVIYHGDSAYGAVSVTDDPRCGSLKTPLPFGPSAAQTPVNGQ